jgi:hypothetical protein
MRTGPTIALYFALFFATAAGILIYATGERDFRLPGGVPRDTAALAGGCYALVFGDEFHRSIDPVQQLPTAVQLTAVAVTDGYFTGWYRAKGATADTLTRSREFGWGEALWRPAGPDSLDVRYLGWPLGIRMRLPADGESLRGRVLLNGDVGGDWARTDTVVGHRIPCAGVSFAARARKVI